MRSTLETLQETHGGGLKSWVEQECWGHLEAAAHNPFSTFEQMWQEITSYWWFGGSSETDAVAVGAYPEGIFL